jgi:hypothetical protein
LVRTENLVRIELVMESRHACGDDRADLPLNLLAGLVKSNSRLEAENAAVRQQLIGLQRKLRGRGRFSKGDRQRRIVAGSTTWTISSRLGRSRVIHTSSTRSLPRSGRRAGRASGRC